MKLNGTRIWIVGASDGIGAALARKALADGARVAVSGRRENMLRALAPDEPRLLPVACDVRSQEQIQTAAATIAEQWGGLDWAVINAGDCEYLNPRQWDNDLIRRVIDINFFGFVNSAQAALPLLANANGRGLLAATASAVVYCPLPRAAAYGASKAAMAHFLRSLEGDFPEIDFSVIYPGFVDTPLTRRNDFAMPFLQTPAMAANFILSGLRRRRAEIAFPRRLVWMLKCLNAMPTRWRRHITARMVQERQT